MWSLSDLYDTLLIDSEIEYLWPRLWAHATDSLVLGTSIHTDSVLWNDILMSVIQGSHHKQMIQKTCSL